MGTRADFYVLLPAHDDQPAEWEWLGSVGWDGMEWAEEEHCPLRRATTHAEYRQAVKDTLKDRDDATLPADGWPWPWDTSRLTDYVYFFANGVSTWDTAEDAREILAGAPPWPDMSKGKQRGIFGPHSGLIVVQSGGEGDR